MNNHFKFDTTEFKINGLSWSEYHNPLNEERFDQAIVKPHQIKRDGDCTWAELLFVTLTLLEKEGLEWTMPHMHEICELMLFVSVSLFTEHGRGDAYIYYIENLFPIKRKRDNPDTCETKV